MELRHLRYFVCAEERSEHVGEEAWTGALPGFPRKSNVAKIV